MILGWRKKKPLIDQKPPSPPYFLAGEDLFIQKEGKEIYVKHIFSVSKNIPKYGPVIMSPGICTIPTCSGWTTKAGAWPWTMTGPLQTFWHPMDLTFIYTIPAIPTGCTTGT